MMELKHIARRDGRLSSFLRGEMRMSTGLMNRLKWDNGIFVNGAPQHTDFPVCAGDLITVPLDEPDPEYPAENGAVTVRYEDDWILAVEKPAGMLVHPSRACFSGTLANFVAGYYRKTGQRCAFHPVTRLDRDTFGIVLLAKNAYSHALLNELHDGGQIVKTYHALTFGAPEQDTGVIDAPIARREMPSLLREVRADGKPSRTEYTVLRREGETALLALRPVTGRTHQLRVHCAFMGFPIVGDPQYGSAESDAFSARLGIKMQRLCARRLEFPHPVTGKMMKLESNMQAVL